MVAAPQGPMPECGGLRGTMSNGCDDYAAHVHSRLPKDCPTRVLRLQRERVVDGERGKIDKQIHEERVVQWMSLASSQDEKL